MEDGLQGAGITAKERLERIEAMLARMDEKLDAKFDTLQNRISLIELNGSKQAQDSEKLAEALELRVRTIETKVFPVTESLEDQLGKLQDEHKRLSKTLDGVRVRMWMAVGGIAAVGAATDIYLRVVNR